MKSRVVAIIQARMGSSRLPGKVLEEICGKPLLWHVIDRLRRSCEIDEIVVATTTNKEDKKLVDFAKREKVGFFQGSEKDVLSRFMGAAEKYGADVIIRICSDVPLMDQKEIDRLVRTLRRADAEYASFSPGIETIHQGFSVCTYEALKRVSQIATEEYEREHVTVYFGEHPDEFKKVYIKPERIFRTQHVRLCVDTYSDLEFIRAIYRRLYSPGSPVDLRKVVRLLKTEPGLLDMNKHVRQKTAKTRGQKVLFRVDASPEIGLGHLVRSIHLAKYLQEIKNCGVLFVTKNHPIAVKKLNDAHMPFKRIPRALNAAEESAAVSKLTRRYRPDIAVFDTKYALDPKLITDMKRLGVKTVSIDNVSSGALASDLTVIPAAHFIPPAKWKHYAGELYFGPEYALLDPIFAKRCARKKHSPPRILVSCGGSDPKNLTMTALKALEKVALPFKAIIVLGPAYGAKNELINQLKNSRYPHELLEDVSDIRALMCESGIGILAFGVTAYEAAAVGLPALVIATSERNQRALNLLAKQGACISGGFAKETTLKGITKKVSKLLNDRRLCSDLSRTGQNLIDGNGIKRVGDLISSPSSKTKVELIPKRY